MRRLALLSAALLALALAGRDARALGAGSVGTSGAAFLKITPSARVSGMGDAFAGVADSVDAIYYNAAGLGTLRKVEVTGMHDQYFQGIDYEYAAMSVPLLAWTDTREDKNEYGTLGIAVFDLQVTGIEQRGTTETDAAIGTFGSSDYAYALSYGYTVPDTGLSLGGTAKFIDETIDTAKASSFATDLGALYRVGRLGIGGGVRNIGTQPEFVAEADPLPLTIFSGVGYKLTDNWIGSVELDQPRDNSTSLALGTEYKYEFEHHLTGAARLGYNTSENGDGGMSGATFGLGLRYGNFDFDFAFVPFGELGNTFKYSLTAKF